MKVLVILAITLICVSAKTLSVEKEWQNFKSTHGKFYRSVLDEQKRYSTFQENLLKIEEHNALYDQGLKSYRQGINQYTDLSSEEFKELLTLKRSEKSSELGKNLFRVPKDAKVPDSIDWRQHGAVTAVKNQGSCGACWAFSVTGSVEGHYFLKNKKLVSFSEQQLIDCAGEAYDNSGCEGGQLDGSFVYIKQYGIEAEDAYPYKEVDDKCRYNNASVITKIQGFVDVEPSNEDALVAAVGLVGPVSVAIDAQFIQNYMDGIYDDEGCSKTELNHGVLAVGYGSQDGMDYWIIKNSWGPEFGKEGYIYMKRGVNICGITVEPSYPVV